MSFGSGAFALLGTGSVALASVHVFGAASLRQPVTLTISIFCGACAAARLRMKTRPFMARMIAPVCGVPTNLTQRSQSPQRPRFSLRSWRFLREPFVVLLLLVTPAGAACAH